MAADVALVEMINKDNVRKTLEVFQSSPELAEYLNRALNTGGSARLYRHTLHRLKGAVDYSNGLIFNLHFMVSCWLGTVL